MKIKRFPELRLPKAQGIRGPGYIEEETEKRSICLHYTAGWDARGAVASWRGAKARIGTAYVVERDGTIYEVFPPQYHARHLGVAGALADPYVIGIEMVNIGFLRRQGDDLVAWMGKRYCGMADEDLYLYRPYRGMAYWPRYPEAQVEAVTDLVAYLRERFVIPKAIPPDPGKFMGEAALKFQGVLGHQNFRADKLDPGPAWDWA